MKCVRMIKRKVKDSPPSRPVEIEIETVEIGDKNIKTVQKGKLKSSQDTNKQKLVVEVLFVLTVAKR